MKNSVIAEALENQDNVARVQDLLKVKSVLAGDIENYIDIDSETILKRNFLKRVCRKKVNMVYQSEPTRQISGNSFLIAQVESSILKTLTTLMKGIAKNVESYGYCYYTNLHGVVPPYFVYPVEGGYVIHKEMKSGTSLVDHFDWVYKNRTVEYLVNGKSEVIVAGEILEIAKDYEFGYPVIENLELAELQIQINKVYSFLKYGHILQSLNPLFTDDPTLKLLDLSTGKINYKNPESKIDTLNMNPKLEATLNFLEHLKSAFFEECGIPEVCLVGDVSASSAKELIAKWFPLLEIFNDLSSFYTVTENKVVNFILREHGALEDVSLRTIFDSNFMPSAIETLEELKFKLQNNVLTLKDLLKRERPALKDEDILNLQKSNETENKAHPTNFGELKQNAKI